MGPLLLLLVLLLLVALLVGLGWPAGGWLSGIALRVRLVNRLLLVGSLILFVGRWLFLLGRLVLLISLALIGLLILAAIYARESWPEYEEEERQREKGEPPDPVPMADDHNYNHDQPDCSADAAVVTARLPPVSPALCSIISSL